MKTNRLVVFAFFIFSFSFFTNCGGSGNDAESQLWDSIVNSNKTNKVPPETLNKILKSLPSPVEMTAIIHRSNAKYDEELINDNDHYEKYTSSYKKSLNLGVYGTDLGYMNIYGETMSSMSYLSAIRSLSEDLKIGQFFDLATIARMGANKNNIDSLMYLSTSSFDKMSTYLNDVNRAHIGSLILIGGWVESLYLSTQIAKKFPTKEMIDRIAEQKIAIVDIMTLLSVYENDVTFKELITDITQIKNLFDGISITYVEGEDKVTVVDGELRVESTTESFVEISDEQLAKIIDKVEIIRNKIIQIN